MGDPSGLGRLLLIMGVVLAIVGAVLLALPKLPWFGRLPGDIVVQRPHVTFYMPLGTCLLLSLIGSLVLWMIGRFWR